MTAQGDDPRFVLAMQHSPVGIAIVGPDGTFLDVNEALCTLLGRPEAALLTATWQELTHPDDLALDAALVDEVLAGLRDEYRLTKRYLRPDGSVVHALLSVAAVRDPGGSVSYFVSQMVDLTEQVELAERYRLLAENVSDVVALGDDDGSLAWVSPSIETVMGWSPDDLVGMPFRDLVHPDDQTVVIDTQSGVSHGEARQMEVRLRRPDGDYRWMSIRVRPVVDDHGVTLGRIAAWWDAEEQHRAREALARSEERYRAALAAKIDAHVFLDAVRDDAGRIVDFVYADANAVALAYLGRTKDDLRATTMLQAYPGQRDSGLFDLYVRTVETGEPLVLDETEISSEVQGTTSFFDFRGVRVGDGVSLTWREVTDRVRFRSELTDSEHRYRLLAENSADAVFQTSSTGVLEWLSPAAEALLGAPVPELLGRPVSELVHPDDQRRFTDPDLRADVPHRKDHRVRVRRGEDWFWVDVTSQPVLDDDGTVVGRTGSLRDVHEQVLAERALAEAEATYRLLAENASDAVIRSDAEGRVDWVAGSTQELFGRANGELVGGSVVELLVPFDVGIDEAARRAALARGETLTGRSQIVRPDGTRHWVNHRSRAVVDDDGRVRWFITAFSDAEAEVAFREALVESERQARSLADRYELARNEALEANQAKTVFLSRMSHELRTPLNAILGFAQLLAMDDLTEDQHDAVAHIRTGGKHLLDLISEILDISRIESGRLSLSMESVSVADAVAEAMDLVRPLAAAAGVTVVRDAHEACVAQVWADRQRVIQILLNLLSNGVKYNRRGGQVSVRCSPVDGPALAIHVHDTGPGLTPGQLERLFQPFERLGAERTTVEGTGIGLTLSDGLARMMSGRIEVTSTPGEGSTFTLVLPTAQAIDEGILVEGAPSPALRAAASTAVLYIEDNPANTHLMTRIAGLREGVALTVAPDGESGIASAQESLPDLVFLDLHLPDMPGESVLRRLLEIPGMDGVPVVVVTADATPGLEHRLKAVGADALITKPVDVGDVLAWMDQPRSGRS